MSRLGVLTVDASLTVRTWDGWIAEMTGIPSTGAVGQPLSVVVPSLAERGLLARFQRVLETGEVQVLAPAFHHYLLPCPPHDPSPSFKEMQQRATLGPLRDGDRIVGVMATIEDVTARMDRERELAGSMREDNWQTRRTAVEELAKTADRDTLVSLLLALRAQHRDFNVLSSALALLATSDIDVTGQIAELLREPDADLRIQAALALGEQHTADAIEPLIRALDDPDVNVRYHAIEALGRLRAVDAVDAIAEIAASGDFFLVFPAVDALARINSPRVAPTLVPLLSRPDVAEAAADALGELGGAEVVRPLVELLNAGGPAVTVARALSRLHARFEQEYGGGGALIVTEFQSVVQPAGAARLLDAVAGAEAGDLRAIVTVLGWLRGAAVERALAHLLGTAAVRTDVIEAIVRQDAGVADLLVEQLDAEDPDVRLAAIVALGRLGSLRAAPAVARMLGEDRALAIAAAGSLARIGDPAMYETLLPLLAHEDAAVRQAAIGALNALGHPAMASRVTELLDSEDPRLRESAVRIAGYFGYRDTIDRLIACADDAVEPVRRAAIEHLPFLDDARASARLGSAITDASPRVRAAAAQALGRLAASEAVRPLIDATRDADPWPRYYAVRSLAEMGDRAALPRLIELAGTDPVMHVRIAALEALGAIGGAEAADALLAASPSADVDLAAAALRALGRVADPRAAAALKAALRSVEPVRRLAAVTAFRAVATEEAAGILVWTAGADADDHVMRAAIEALGTMAKRDGDAGDAAARGLLATAADPLRRDAIVAALASLPETRISAVADGLAHRHPDVRRAVISALGRLHHPDASAAIRSALDDDDAGVREDAILALDRLGARGIARKLAAMAHTDPSHAVRRAASAAMGRSGAGR